MSAPVPAVLLVRMCRGVVGESQRTCHVVPLPDGEGVPERLTAYCGTEIESGQAEVFDRPVGMPCTVCLVRAPLPEQSELSGGTRHHVF